MKKFLSYARQRVFSSPFVGAGALGAVYLAVLPMAGTIALRNIALFGTLLILLASLPKIHKDIQLGWVVYAWAAYLLIFPWIASDPVAWQSLVGQWGRSLLAIFAGAGLAVLFHQRRWGSVFFLGVISSIPILVHLMLFTWRGLETGTIPWGYWGRERHHADLGYAAGHAVILLSVSLFRGSTQQRLVAILLIFAALLSTAFARSRAGFSFAVFGVALVFLLYCLVEWKQNGKKILSAFLVLFFLFGGIFALATKNDSRWDRMLDRLNAGLLGDSLQIACEGTAAIEPLIRTLHRETDYANQLIEGIRHGDGSRTVVLRAGIRLSADHPWGSDGSRQAFRKLLAQECPDPKLITSHAHNAWIDTALALGWGGALLYLMLLLMFLRLGFLHLKSQSPNSEWAVVLVAVSMFWMIRGLTDSVFRDHMLEMQGFFLAFAAVSLRRVAS